VTDGRTVWWSKDAAWWRRERIVELAEEFGAEGPAVIDWLSCEAKAENHGGRVRTGFRSMTRGAFISSVELTRTIVLRAAEIGLLDDIEERGPEFSCRVVRWREDQAAGCAAASGDIRAERENSAPGFHTLEQRRARSAFYGDVCWICRTAPVQAMDHVKPLAAGGSQWPANLRPACRPCNSSKGSKWPYTRPESA
jgi:hypothetical protein